MIDTHCHLDFKEYNKWREEAISNALSTGVHTMINIGADLNSSRNSIALAEKYDCIYATVGVHPHDASSYDDALEGELECLSVNKKVVAVGEIGLDFYRDLSPRGVQRRVFRRQLEMAIEKKLPVVIHSRDSFRETVDIIKEYAGELIGGIFHCFPGTPRDAFEVIDLGFHISVGGVITFPKAKMADVATNVPLEYILLETDSPYLTPAPVRGKTNQPAYIRYIRDKLAALRKISVEEIEKATDRNARKVYRLADVFGG
jgi:TatD DNase family protein